MQAHSTTVSGNQEAKEPHTSVAATPTPEARFVLSCIMSETLHVICCDSYEKRAYILVTIALCVLAHYYIAYQPPEDIPIAICGHNDGLVSCGDSSR